MARTAEMKLLELMVLKEDISAVIEYIGKKGSFQFQKKEKSRNAINQSDENAFVDVDSQFYDEIKSACSDLSIDLSEVSEIIAKSSSPTEKDRESAGYIIQSYRNLSKQLTEAKESASKIQDAYKEAMAFSNLQVSYAELEHLSFLSLKIGKISSGKYEDLKNALEGNAVVIPLGDDKSHLLIASSKKGRFALDSILKEYDFVTMEIPPDFKGVPQNVLDGLKKRKIESESAIEELEIQKKNFAETHKQSFIKLAASFAIAVQIEGIKRNLESTELVYRITGWIPAGEAEAYMKELEDLTEGRIAIREFEPYEVPAVMNGIEDVPVKLEHGKFVKSFERMIFSYGSPVYGTIDPSPFVAIFFTILFGIMFGDFGQGMFFVLFGILMMRNVIKVGRWNKFAPIFMSIGISSSIMGLLTGEFFGTEKVLEPFAEWVTGFFGTPHAPILKLMPSSDPNSIFVMFGVFGAAVAIGFVINTCGLLLNIINNIIRKKYAQALFGKNGLAGAIFFWYVIALILRIVIAHHSVAVYDIVIIAVSLFFAAFAEPFALKLEGKKELFENGFGAYFISSIVEIIEVISGYLSNTISFVRVGAFALSHAVLNFTILTLTNMCGGVLSPGGILIMILGNALIIVLEGMIVAIQVIRLQYYEFFSKFFHETGSEFKPFVFEAEIDN
ncbi:V-type ATP synthase subunit I [Treponema sp. Marseille-Q3903]|uniref:V-type ATP synthase subunit I n=1 Tax=Treponema sp. Marseille-Q3903 TaxID=2766703 RepID=UPI001652509C|nr:V-type ATPase 116kDa subunit family protein [Treponema sp. Marseille-Q3903]MBC6714190.1 ATPase [Treponema sp. Marseille-Q3903]